MGALTKIQEEYLVETQQELARNMTKLTAVLPKHVTPDRFARTVMTALTQKPDLLNAPLDTLMTECIRCASDGLLPDGKEAALVPRYGKVFSLAYQPMIAGIKKKVRNSGEVSTWDVVAVRENDAFEFGYGLEPYLRHSYDIRKPRGRFIAVYSVAVLKDGTKTFDIMSEEDVNRIRDRSDAYKAFVAKKIRSTPWESDYEEMAKKTVARRHSKDLPSSTDLDRLLYQGDDRSPVIDYGDLSRAASAGAIAKEEPRGLANKLDELGEEDKVDPDTGEISDEDKSRARREATDVEDEDPIETARAAGAAAKREGKAKRSMPVEYRNDDELSEAWVDGFDAAEKG